MNFTLSPYYDHLIPNWNVSYDSLNKITTFAKNFFLTFKGLCHDFISSSLLFLHSVTHLSSQTLVGKVLLSGAFVLGFMRDFYRSKEYEGLKKEKENLKKQLEECLYVVQNQQELISHLNEDKIRFLHQKSEAYQELAVLARVNLDLNERYISCALHLEKKQELIQHLAQENAFMTNLISAYKTSEVFTTNWKSMRQDLDLLKTHVSNLEMHEVLKLQLCLERLPEIQHQLHHQLETIESFADKAAIEQAVEPLLTLVKSHMSYIQKLLEVISHASIPLASMRALLDPVTSEGEVDEALKRIDELIKCTHPHTA